MLNSMTGFGDAKLEEQGISFQVEIKTLNNRFLKTAVKLPDVASFAEAEVERIIRQSLNRGSVTYTLHLRQTSDVGVFDINSALLEKYVRTLKQVCTLQGDNGLMSIDLASILQIPGVCQPRECSAQEQSLMLETIKRLTHEALGRLRSMRQEEGKSLEADLQEQVSTVRENLTALAGLAGRMVDDYRRRVRKRVDAMLAEVNLKLDEELLFKEVALFAERCDINEEMSRLESHLVQFEEVFRKDEQAGRRLDFLTQEMLREANTIASKANDAQIAYHVVEIKVAIDRMREQVQNVE